MTTYDNDIIMMLFKESQESFQEEYWKYLDSSLPEILRIDNVELDKEGVCRRQPSVVLINKNKKLRVRTEV